MKILIGLLTGFLILGVVYIIGDVIPSYKAGKVENYQNLKMACEKSGGLFGTFCDGSQCDLNCVRDGSTNYELETRCDLEWEPGVCEAIIFEGYYYSREKNECIHFPGGSGCSNPPFNTEKECRKTCVF